METTTGISAAPIGIIIKKPMRKARMVNPQKKFWFWFKLNKITTDIKTIPRKAFKKCWNLKVMGLPDIIPCNFPNAIIEPEKVFAPIAEPKLISIRLAIGILPESPIPYALGLWKAAPATITAAKPTKLWNAAINCGRAVIWIFKAIEVPITPPIKIPRTIKT